MTLFATGALFLFFACFLPLAFFQTAKRIWVPYLIVLALFYAIESMMISWQRQHQGPSILHDFLWVLILGALLFLVSFPLSMRLYAHQRSSAFGAAASPFHRWRDRTSPPKLPACSGKTPPCGPVVQGLHPDPQENVGVPDPCGIPPSGNPLPHGQRRPVFPPPAGDRGSLQLLALDEQAQWTFALRLYPYPPRSLVLSRYLWGWIFLLLGLGLDVGTAYLLYPNYLQLPIPTETPFFLFWITGVVLAVQAVEIPLLFRIGVVHGRSSPWPCCWSSFLCSSTCWRNSTPTTPVPPLPIFCPH